MPIVLSRRKNTQYNQSCSHLLFEIVRVQPSFCYYFRYSWFFAVKREHPRRRRRQQQWRYCFLKSNRVFSLTESIFIEIGSFSWRKKKKHREMKRKSVELILEYQNPPLDYFQCRTHRSYCLSNGGRSCCFYVYFFQFRFKSTQNCTSINTQSKTFKIITSKSYQPLWLHECQFSKCNRLIFSFHRFCRIFDVAWESERIWHLKSLTITD